MVLQAKQQQLKQYVAMKYFAHVIDIKEEKLEILTVHNALYLQFNLSPLVSLGFRVLNHGCIYTEIQFLFMIFSTSSLKWVSYEQLQIAR